MARSLTDYLENPEVSQEGVQSTNSRSFLDLTPANIQDTSYGSGPISVNRYNYDPSRYDIGGINPYELSNLEDIRANNQGVFDALGRSTLNLIGKTGVNVIGGTLGTIYGAGSAIANGEISKLWDNSLTTVLDSASEAIGDTFRVYKSADYEERSLLGRLFTHPIQFTDEFMDTLSFTTGAVVTELLTAGLASATIAPRALKYLKGLGRGAEAMEAANAMKIGGLASKLGNAGTLTRQLATGAAWEASVEARHGAIELKNNMYAEAMEEYGIQDPSMLPEEVVNDIEDRASNAGLFTFLTNMALVGGSNIVQFPKIFGAGYNTSKRAGNRIAIEAGKAVDTALPTNRTGRYLRNIATAAKNPFMEGIVEEGGQSVLSNTANMYWDRKNDTDAQDEVNRFLNSFGTALKDTYTTGEGWYEIGMGMLIGSLGAPGRGIIPGQRGINQETGQRHEIWTGGIVGSFQERSARDNEVANLVDGINQSPELRDAMKANYDFLTTAASIQPEQDRALARDDTFMFENYRDDMLHSWIDSRIKAGLSSDLDTQVEELRKISPEDFYVSFRGEELADKTSEKDKISFKQNMINNLETQINNTREAYRVVDNAYFGDNEDIRQELIYNIASAKNIDIRENNINKSLSDLTNGAINNINIRGERNVTLANLESDLKNQLKDEELSTEDKEDIQNRLDNITEIKKVKGYSNLNGAEVNALDRFITESPVEAKLNLSPVIKMLNDSKKLRNRRQNFIELYNTLFTEKGQKEFAQYQKELKEALEKQRADAEAKKAKEDENKAVKKNQKDIKKKSDNIKKEEAKKVDNAPMTEEEVAALERELDELDDNLQAPAGSSVSTVQTSPSGTPSTEESVVTPEVIEDASEAPKLTPEESTVVKIVESEEQQEEAKEVNTDGYVTNDLQAEPKTNQIIDLSRKREVGNTITSLNINKEEVIDPVTRTSDIVSEVDDEGYLVINQNFDSRLQDPNQFNEGAGTTMILPTYQQMMDAGMRSDYTIEEYNQDVADPEKLPIAFTDNTGKIIGYLPTTDNVRNRVREDLKDAEIIKNQELRNFIASNPGNYNVKITKKSTGVPMFVKTNGKLYDRLGNGERLSEGVQIAVYKNGLRNGLNSVIDTKIALPKGMSKDDYFKEGVVYTIVPTADGVQSFAFAGNINPVGTQRADDIVRMIQLYRANPQFKRDSDLIQEREDLKSEIDFSNYQQFNAAVEDIIYTNSTNSIFEVDSKNNKLRLGITKDKVFDLDDFMKNQSTRDKVAYELAGRYPSVRLSNFGNRFNTYQLNNGVLQQQRYRNYFDYLNDKDIVQTRLQGQPIEGTDKLYFTAQSVIEFSSPIASTPQNTTESTEETVERAAPLNTAKRIGTVRPKKRSKVKTKPDIQDDYDLLNNIDEPYVKSGINEIFNENPELVNIGTQEQYSQYLDTIFPDSQVKDIVYHGTDPLRGKSGIDKEGFKKPNRDRLIGGKNQIGIFFTDKENASNFSKDLQVDLAEQAANRFEDTLSSERKAQLRDTSKPILIPAIINASNPINLTRHDLQKQWEDLPNKVNSVLITDLAGKYGYEKVVFEPEQIHILGSKQDVEGFKEFVKNNKLKSQLEIQAENLMRICKS